MMDFTGGLHDSMVTLENKVCGLERVVEEMARDLSLSSGRRSSNMMLGFEGLPGRSSSKYKGGLLNYSGLKFGTGGDSRMLFAERFLSSEDTISDGSGRDPPWRSDSETWDSYGYTGSRNGLMSFRRGLSSASIDSRSPKTAEHEGYQPSSRSAWDKGQGSFPELDAEALTDDTSGLERGPLWALWTRAMNFLHVGDEDSAYTEVLSSADDMLLTKLMESSGPIVDQHSSEVASEVLHAVERFLKEQSLFNISLTWIQQLICAAYWSFFRIHWIDQRFLVLEY